MDNSTFNLLCEASQLSFTDTQREAFMPQLEALIELGGKVKNIETDSDFNEAVHRSSVKMDDLREDIALESMPAEELLANTKPLFDCCVIPKLMD